MDRKGKIGFIRFIVVYKKIKNVYCNLFIPANEKNAESISVSSTRIFMRFLVVLLFHQLAFLCVFLGGSVVPSTRVWFVFLGGSVVPSTRVFVCFSWWFCCSINARFGVYFLVVLFAQCSPFFFIEVSLVTRFFFTPLSLKIKSPFIALRFSNQIKTT